ncbi:MBL fold metallo-hydrolase [Breznakiella homolactica]|uniref:MBL fold metallo-hydrolase n=1 Tax=Breznakiella homolactica TaxID=2798577 RepID=A0A7T8B9I8_9SPIR|nr:MBL fold metallo-hydrolase [Breznakiella homolactica]QQO08507.1 MBL fold metallo-hydrolase [Breznakiella homolactica]
MAEQTKTPSPQELMERCCRRPWEAYVPPFKMAENVYYIAGNDWVSCFLIDTKDGLILIDTAMHETVYLLLENIRLLGFKPKDIKKILLSHAHIDHIGGARTLKELTGATVYLGKRDLLFVTERKDLIAGEGYTCGDIYPDELYDDNTPITLGNISIRTVSTPGHTPGCTSFFFDVQERGKTLRCGMHGGLGLNTMSRKYFEENGQPISLREEFAEGLRKLDKMDVDVCLPSHTNQVEILRDVDKIRDDFNPYVDSAVWHTMLNKRLDMALALFRQDP